MTVLLAENTDRWFSLDNARNLHGFTPQIHPWREPKAPTTREKRIYRASRQRCI